MPLIPKARNTAESLSTRVHFRQSALRSFMTTSAFSSGSSRSSGTLPANGRSSSYQHDQQTGPSRGCARAGQKCSAGRAEVQRRSGQKCSAGRAEPQRCRGIPVEPCAAHSRRKTSSVLRDGHPHRLGIGDDGSYRRAAVGFAAHITSSTARPEVDPDFGTG